MIFKDIIKGAILILVLAGIGLLIQEIIPSEVFGEHWLDLNVRGTGISGQLLFVLCSGFLICIGMPRQAISFAAGYVYGLAEGTLLGLLATSLGCFCTFWIARIFGQNFVLGKLSGKVKQIDIFLSKNPFSMALLIRLLPVGSNMLTNLTAGVSSVSALPFISGSTLGFVPQTFIFCLVATGINIGTATRLGLSILLFSISASIGIYLYRKTRRCLLFGEEPDGTFEK